MNEQVNDVSSEAGLDVAKGITLEGVILKGTAKEVEVTQEGVEAPESAPVQ